ncbi:MAG: hypothetical protein KC468_10060 [Myxococcales bacterium]|nr:hypothetical protein [Myxococcales bacterium]
MLPRISLIVSLSLPTFALACVPTDDELPGSDPHAPESDSDALVEIPERFVSASAGEPGDDDPERWDEDLPVVLPPWWKCGDNVVDSWEACDDGALNGEHKQCTPKCQLATCGDGYIHTDEECDNGSANGQSPGSYGSCTANCTVDVGCGDWIVQPQNEECDEGPWGDMNCTPHCEWFGRVMFVTQGTYTGSQIGGIAGADEICQNEAEGLLASPGSFRAWLSTGTESVSDWIAEDMENSKIMRPDGEVVADTLALLKANNLNAPILVTAAGDEILNAGVWTNTTPEGHAASGDGENVDDCGGWETDVGFSYRGMNMALDSSWTIFGDLVKCSAARHLYCLEQPEPGDGN